MGELKTKHQPLAEQETTIWWTEEDDTVEVSTTSPITTRTMARLGVVPYWVTYYADGVVASWFYRVPRSNFRFGLKRAPGGRGRRFSAVVGPTKSGH